MVANVCPGMFRYISTAISISKDLFCHVTYKAFYGIWHIRWTIWGPEALVAWSPWSLRTSLHRSVSLGLYDFHLPRCYCYPIRYSYVASHVVLVPTPLSHLSSPTVICSRNHCAVPYRRRRDKKTFFSHNRKLYDCSSVWKHLQTSFPLLDWCLRAASCGASDRLS